MYGSFLTSPAGLFNEFERLRRDLDGAFGDLGRPSSIRAVAHGSFPAINVGSTPQSLEIYAFAPGLERDKIEASIERGLLTLAGERAAEAVDRDERRNVYAHERPTGRWKRVVSLPDDIDPQSVAATYRDGLLHVSVKRRAAVEATRIQVQ